MRSPRVVLLLAALAGLPGASARAEVVSEVSPTRVELGTFYHGTTLEVGGSVGEHSQVAVVVTGPTEHHLFNRRDRIAGFIWGGVEHVAFRRAPSLYLLSTSAALPVVARQAVRENLRLGYEALQELMEVSVTDVDTNLLASELVRLKEREGLYRLAPGGVHLGDVEDGRRPFLARVAIPAAAPQGILEVAVLETVDGDLVDTRTSSVELTRVGLPAWLYSVAHERGTLFGVLAVVVTLVMGVATDLAGGLRSPERRRSTARTLRVVAREARSVLPGIRLPVRSPDEVARLHHKYQLFKSLLTVNNEVLELLTELEEESSWSSLQHPRVRMGIRALFDGTGDMVGLLNQLSGERYFDLVNVVASIRRDVTDLLADAAEPPSAPLVLAMSKISSTNGSLVGGKALNLARLAYDLDLEIPRFAVVTTEAYRQLLDSGGIAGELRNLLGSARADAPEEFRSRCELARGLVEGAAVPVPVAEAIRSAYHNLEPVPGEAVVVRSSSSGEDSQLSFAGQFMSLLNVPEPQLVDAWKRVVASRFAPGAVFYRRAAGLAEVDTPMAVIIQRMVPARASGIVFTRRPDQAKSPVVLVSAVAGLGVDASTGVAAADDLVVSRSPRRVLERRVVAKSHRLVKATGGGLVLEPVAPADQLKPAVSDEEALRLVEVSLAIERYFGSAQDIEWAMGQDGKVVVLQARPLGVEKRTARVEVPAGARPLLSGGRTAWPGRAVGPVHVVRDRHDEDRLPTGAVLVTPQLLPDCVRLLPRVSGIVVERGTVTGHAASIVREFRVPCLFGASAASETLTQGQLVSLDAAGGAVYAGVLWPELRGRLPVTLVGRRAAGLPSLLAGKLTKLSGSSFMSSWTCQSLHDVIRFVHEMAIQEMFEIGDRLAGSAIGGVKRFESPEPVNVLLLDLGGGLHPDAANRRTVTSDLVTSTPFHGFWHGFGDPRLEPRRVGEPTVGAFASVLMSTTSGGAARALDAPSYACITDCYLNLNSRQAYHFAIVDAYLSENDNANHVSLRLKGGGAAAWQRGLRAEVVAEILRLHHFESTAQGDLVNGWCRGVDVATGLEKLRLVGHLLRFSAQLDMWMTDEAAVRRYVEEFVTAEAAALDGGAV